MKKKKLTKIIKNIIIKVKKQNYKIYVEYCMNYMYFILNL